MAQLEVDIMYGGAPLFHKGEENKENDPKQELNTEPSKKRPKEQNKGQQSKKRGSE